MKIAYGWGFGNTNKRNYFVIILSFDYNGGMRGIRILTTTQFCDKFENFKILPYRNVFLLYLFIFYKKN